MLAVLMGLVGFSSEARASELEVVVYDMVGESETLLFAQEWDAPETQTWPQTFDVGASGSVRVVRTTAPAGHWRFCVEFKKDSQANAIQGCAQLKLESSPVSILASTDQDFYYIGLSLSSGSFSAGIDTDASASVGSVSQCSVTCSDGSGCSIECIDSGCRSRCNPAMCACG